MALLKERSRATSLHPGTPPFAERPRLLVRRPLVAGTLGRQS